MTGTVGDKGQDRRSAGIENAVAAVLRLGVAVSSVIIAAGIAVDLLDARTHRSLTRQVAGIRRGVLHPTGAQAPHSVASVIQGLGHGEGTAIVMLGLLLLILTPVMRVAVSVVGFAAERDRRFVLITLTVLAVLIGSFAIGA